MAVSENGFDVVLLPEGSLQFRDRLAAGEVVRSWDAGPGETAALLAVVAEARALVEDYHTLLPFVAERLGCDESTATALGISPGQLAADLGYAVDVPAAAAPSDLEGDEVPE